MASVKRKKRDYKRERQLAIRRGETGVGSKSGDAQRHRARRIVEKDVGDLSPTQVVDHKKRVRDGGSNDRSNLRVRSLSSNAADGGRVGDRKGKGVRKKK
uniref:HNH endonuclease n=2 Tax=unclassified bacterial viruses TaxID=12333 RepID=A0AAU6W1W0_9VIRU